MRQSQAPDDVSIYPRFVELAMACSSTTHKLVVLWIIGKGQRRPRSSAKESETFRIAIGAYFAQRIDDHVAAPVFQPHQPPQLQPAAIEMRWFVILRGIEIPLPRRFESGLRAGATSRCQTGRRIAEARRFHRRSRPLVCSSRRNFARIVSLGDLGRPRRRLCKLACDILAVADQLCLLCGEIGLALDNPSSLASNAAARASRSACRALRSAASFSNRAFSAFCASASRASLASTAFCTSVLGDALGTAFGAGVVFGCVTGAFGMRSGAGAPSSSGIS